VPKAPEVPLAFDFGAVVQSIDLTNRQAVNTCDGLFLVQDCLRVFAFKCFVHVKGTTTGDGVPTFHGFKREIGRRVGDELFYLPEETKCRVGYLLKGISVARLRNSPVRPVSCNDTLLPGDPVFKCSHSKLCDNGDIEIDCQGTVYHATKHAFDGFSEASRKLQKPEIRRSHWRPCAPREMFLRFAGHLNRSRALECRSAEIQEQFKGAAFRRHRRWVFVIEKGNAVTTCLWLRKDPQTVFTPVEETPIRPCGTPGAGGVSVTRR